MRMLDLNTRLSLLCFFPTYFFKNNVTHQFDYLLTCSCLPWNCLYIDTHHFFNISIGSQENVSCSLFYHKRNKTKEIMRDNYNEGQVSNSWRKSISSGPLVNWHVENDQRQVVIKIYSGLHKPPTQHLILICSYYHY